MYLLHFHIAHVDSKFMACEGLGGRLQRAMLTEGHAVHKDPGHILMWRGCLRRLCLQLFTCREEVKAPVKLSRLLPEERNVRCTSHTQTGDVVQYARQERRRQGVCTT